MHEGLLRVSVVMILLLTVPGCWTPPPPPPTIGPLPVPLTALQAYRAIKPAMEAWHSEVYVVQIVALSPDAPGLHLLPDGRSFWWNFETHFDSEKGTVVTQVEYLPDGSIIVGYDGIQGKEIGGGLTTGPVPMEEVIDSIAAASIAQSGGIPPKAVLDRMELRNRKDLPLTWELFYWSQDGPSGHVYVNARTGEIVDNEFAHPTPTPSMPPHVYRLDITVRGNVNFHIMNPQGQQLGFDAVSGEIINEVPYAEVVQWLTGESENPSTITKFRIPDPVEGHYRVETDGSPSSERRYFLLSAFMYERVKTSWDITIPSDQEFTFAYEFVYTTSDEKLISDLIQVEP